jgi:hypothetical protein
MAQPAQKACRTWYRLGLRKDLLVVVIRGRSPAPGGFHKVGFEGGQMPLQRRLPKRGFVSLDEFAECRSASSESEKLPVTEIDLLDSDPG